MSKPDYYKRWERRANELPDPKPARGKFDWVWGIVGLAGTFAVFYGIASAL